MRSLGPDLHRPGWALGAAVAAAISLTAALAACDDDAGRDAGKDTRDSSTQEPSAAATPTIEPPLGPPQFRRVLEASQPPTPTLGTTPSPSPAPSWCASVAGTVLDPDAPARACDEEGLTYRLAPAEIVGGVEDAEAARPQNQVGWVVEIDLDDEAAAIFADLSQELQGTDQRVAIVLDGVVLSAPAITAPVTQGKIQISGNLTEQEVTDLAARLAAAPDSPQAA